MIFFSLQSNQNTLNADGETWTRKAEATRSLDVRVYQFRHVRQGCSSTVGCENLRISIADSLKLGVSRRTRRCCDLALYKFIILN